MCDTGETGLKEIFAVEAKELLEKVESDVVKLEEDFDNELLNSIFRYVHTLKGSSGLAGFTDVYEFAHQLENLMERLRSGRLEVDKGIADLLLHSIDWIRLSVFGGEDEDKKVSIRDSLLVRIAAYEEENNQPSKNELEVGNRYFSIKADFREDIFDYGIDPLHIMEDLFSLGTVIEKKINKRIDDFINMDPEKCYLGWELVLKTKHTLNDIMGIFIFVKDDNEISAVDITEQYVDNGEFLEEKRIGEILLSKGIITEEEFRDVLSDQDLKNKRLGVLIVEKGYATEKEVQYALGEQERIKTRIETDTVRVAADKLDGLMNLLGEIIIGQSSISRIADDMEDERGFKLKNAIHGLSRTTREFQERIMSIRMIPIGPTFEQFRRFVRDSANDVGKDIHIEIRGGDTELDKGVIEKIGDPLKHLIRNAVDHGLEAPEQRLASGKSRAGTIRLNSYHQEGNVYIEVKDDGMGIDRAALRKRAESMELVRADEEISDSRLYSFMFLPGFSTADSVGELSGRGVGMDVVKTNIDSLRGNVEIESEEGKGTTFRLCLPLTLAIIDGMLVKVGDHVYIIPLLSIVESIQPKKEEVKTIEGRGEMVMVRGEYVTLVRLYDYFGVSADIANPWESLVVIVESSGEKIGLMIDDLLGQQQTVIKSLDGDATDSRTLSGAAILGDGRVALIIDVHGLIGEISE